MCVRVCLCVLVCVSDCEDIFLGTVFFCPLDSSMTFYFSVAFEESMYSGTFFTMHSINLLSKFPRLTCVQGLLIHSTTVAFERGFVARYSSGSRWRQVGKQHAA